MAKTVLWSCMSQTDKWWCLTDTWCHWSFILTAPAKFDPNVRGGSRTAATSKTECFVIIVNGLQPLTIITKRSILDVAAALDPPLGISSESISWKSDGDLFSGSPLDFRKRRFLWKDFVKTLTWRHPNQPWYCDF